MVAKEYPEKQEPRRITSTPDETIDVEGLLKSRRREGREVRRAVLFVHGFTGDQDATWTNRGVGTQFDSLLFEDPDLSDYDVFKFRYRSQIHSGNDVKGLARRLRQAIDEINHRPQGGRGPYEIVLIAHSLGGLVCMRYILDCLIVNQQPPVVALMLYSTPISGTGLVTILRGSLVAAAFKFPPVRWLSQLWFGRQKQLDDLETASSFVSELQTDWAGRVLNGGHASVGSGRMWLPVRVVSAEQDAIVSEQSAKGFYGAIDWLTLDYGHIDVCKPSSHADDRYLAAKRFLEVSRRSNGPKIQQAVWTLSQRIWDERSNRLVRDLKYRTFIHAEPGSASPVDAGLLAAGLSPCLTSCVYKAVLRRPPVKIGVAFGFGGREVWDGDVEPELVHTLALSLVPKATREKALKGLAETMNRPMEEAWTALLPACAVEIDGIPLVARDLERAHGEPYEWMRREFHFPDGPAGEALEKKIGNEVTYLLKYQSVVPEALAHFRFLHRWITDGSECVVSVNRKLDYLVSSSALGSGQSASESLGDDGRSVQFSTRETLLPGAQFAASWWVASEQADRDTSSGG